MYSSEEHDGANKMILHILVVRENAPKVCEFFGKKLIFCQKNANISKTTEVIKSKSNQIKFISQKKTKVNTWTFQQHKPKNENNNKKTMSHKCLCL